MINLVVVLINKSADSKGGVHTSEESYFETASNVIIKGKSVLLILEGEGATNSGLYSVPGGRFKNGESPEDCAIREAGEEVGVKIRIVKKLGVLEPYRVNGKILVGHVFRSEIVSGVPVPCGGIKEIRWATLAEVVSLRKGEVMIKGPLYDAVSGHLAEMAMDAIV